MLVRYPKNILQHNHQEIYKDFPSYTTTLPVLSNDVDIKIELKPKKNMNAYTIGALYKLLITYTDLLKNTDIITTEVTPPVNIKRFEKFIYNIENGIEDSVRIIRYNIDGEPSISTAYFDGNIITVVVDNTKNKEKNEGTEIINYEGHSIEKIETDSSIKYYLKNKYMQDYEKKLLYYEK